MTGFTFHSLALENILLVVPVLLIVLVMANRLLSAFGLPSARPSHMEELKSLFGTAKGQI